MCIRDSTHTGGIGRNRNDVQTRGARAAGRGGGDDGGAPEFRSRGVAASVAAAVSAVSRGSAPGFRASFLDAFSKLGSVSRCAAPGSRGALDQPG